jgi:hypothetical protein
MLGRGACEFLPDLKLLVSFWPVVEFADDEWDAYVAAIRHHAHTVVGLRVLSWNCRNATPRPEQQKRMSAVMGATTHKVAVVTPEPPNGFATSVLAFVNPNIRAFSEQQWNEAWDHLGLAADARVSVERALQRLRDRVG